MSSRRVKAWPKDEEKNFDFAAKQSNKDQLRSIVYLPVLTLRATLSPKLILSNLKYLINCALLKLFH